MCLGADLDLHIMIDETMINGDTDLIKTSKIVTSFISPDTESYIVSVSKRRSRSFRKDQFKITLSHGCMLTLSGTHFKVRSHKLYCRAIGNHSLLKSRRSVASYAVVIHSVSELDP